MAIRKYLCPLVPGRDDPAALEPSILFELPDLPGSTTIEYQAQFPEIPTGRCRVINSSISDNLHRVIIAIPNVSIFL